MNNLNNTSLNDKIIVVIVQSSETKMSFQSYTDGGIALISCEHGIKTGFTIIIIYHNGTTKVVNNFEEMMDLGKDYFTEEQTTNLREIYNGKQKESDPCQFLPEYLEDEYTEELGNGIEKITKRENLITVRDFLEKYESLPEYKDLLFREFGRFLKRKTSTDNWVKYVNKIQEERKNTLKSEATEFLVNFANELCPEKKDKYIAALKYVGLKKLHNIIIPHDCGWE